MKYHDLVNSSVKYLSSHWQIIGIVVANTHDNAKSAANKVLIEYSELPAILSIEEAVKNGSFHPNTKRCLVKGNVEQCFLPGACDRIISGEVHVGGQEHFYMEPQCTLVWPVDSGNEIHMVSSTQVCSLFTALNSQWKAQVSERAWLLATAKPKAATPLIAAIWLVPELRPPQLLQ